jgi:hypothetical protein
VSSCTDLCVPSMGAIQRRFKSSVYFRPTSNQNPIMNLHDYIDETLARCKCDDITLPYKLRSQYAKRKEKLTGWRSRKRKNNSSEIPLDSSKSYGETPSFFVEFFNNPRMASLTFH